MALVRLLNQNSFRDDIAPFLRNNLLANQKHGIPANIAINVSLSLEAIAQKGTMY